MPFRNLYQFSLADLNVAKENIDENLRIEKIRRSKSPYESPLSFPRDNDGSLHGVIDYRELGRMTKRNRTGIPRTDEMFDGIGNTRFLSVICLNPVFNKILIHPDDMQNGVWIEKRKI